MLKKQRLTFYVTVLWCVAVIFSSCKTSKTATKPSSQQPTVSTPPPSPKPAPKDTVAEKKPEILKRNMVLIMPFELEQNFAESTEETIEPIISQSSLSAVNFYEGAQLAIDSLKAKNIEVKLHAYDTPSDSISTVRMLTNAAIKEADLVIGTFPNNLAPVAAQVAKNHNIKLLLTQGSTPDMLKENSQVALAFASTVTQCREMVNFMLDQYTGSNVILIYRTTKREDELAEFFRNEISKRKSDFTFTDFNATQKMVEDIPALLSKSIRNLVFVVSSDEAFVSPLLSLLEEQNIFGIKIVGLPTWLNFESIDFMTFKNVQTYFFDNNFIQMNSMEDSPYRKQFITKYHNDPLTSAFNGFDLVYHFGFMLREKNLGMDKMAKSAFPETNKSFNFSGAFPDGLENKSISVLTITDYQLERLNK